MIEISIDGEKVAECESLEFDRDVLEGPSTDGYMRKFLGGEWSIEGKIKNQTNFFARTNGCLESRYYPKPAIKSEFTITTEFNHPSGPVVWFLGKHMRCNGNTVDITAKQELRQV
jgi:hypothetical protein